MKFIRNCLVIEVFAIDETAIVAINGFYALGSIMIAQNSSWVLTHNSVDKKPFQVIFSSHGVPQGNFEFKSDLEGLPGQRLFLNTPNQDFFEGGVPETADSFQELIEQIKEMAGNRSIVVMGSATGGFAAIRAGIALKAQTVLTFSPILDLDAPLSPALKVENAASVPDESRNLLPLIEGATDTQFIIMSAEWDIFHMSLQAQLAGLDHVTNFGILNVNTGVATHLKEDETLQRIYSRVLSGKNRHLAVRGTGALTKFPDIAADLLAAKTSASSGDWDTAVPLLEKSLSVLPDCEIALEQLGVYYTTQSDKETALDYYTQCAEMNPNRKVYKDKLANLARSLKIKDQHILELSGIEGFSKSLGLRDEAEALMAKKDFVGAAETFRAAYARNPDDAGAALGEVTALRKAGAISEAGRAMKTLLKTDPANHAFQHNMGVILLKSRDPQRAIPYLSDALQQQPRNPGYAHQLASALAQSKKLSEALIAIEVATTERPDNAGFQFTKAEIALDLKSYKTAEEAAREAVRIEPERAAYFAILAETLAGQPGKINEATEFMRIALTLDFDNETYKKQLASYIKESV